MEYLPIDILETINEACSDIDRLNLSLVCKTLFKTQKQFLITKQKLFFVNKINVVSKEMKNTVNETTKLKKAHKFYRHLISNSHLKHWSYYIELISQGLTMLHGFVYDSYINMNKKKASYYRDFLLIILELNSTEIM